MNATESVGRFNIVPENRLVSPGKCCVCGSISGDFIDFNWSQDFYGAIYFCRTCIEEACRLINFIPASELDEIIVSYEEISYKYREVVGENNELRDALDIISRYRSDNPDLEPVAVVEPEGQESDSEGSETADKGAESDNSGSNVGSNEQDSKHRFTSLRDDEDTESIFSSL